MTRSNWLFPHRSRLSGHCVDSRNDAGWRYPCVTGDSRPIETHMTVHRRTVNIPCRQVLLETTSWSRQPARFCPYLLSGRVHAYPSQFNKILSAFLARLRGWAAHTQTSENLRCHRCSCTGPGVGVSTGNGQVGTRGKCATRCSAN